MTRGGLGHSEQDAVREFVDAVRALSDDPGAANLERYLAVSRELEELRRPRARPRGRGKRPVRVEAAKADA
jgi:hypothetical protein